MKEFKIDVTLKGALPIMFDRYPGDNKTQLPVREKAALNARDEIVVPSLNLLSMLAAENTQSVSKLFGKAGKAIARDIKAGLSIDAAELPLLCKGKAVVMPEVLTANAAEQVYVRLDVARVKAGIPNPKQRPVVNTPWSLDFAASFLEGEECKIATLRDAFARAGRYIGLGTFRPLFGQFEVSRWDVEEV
jgi:hypothetical protein